MFRAFALLRCLRFAVEAFGLDELRIAVVKLNVVLLSFEVVTVVVVLMLSLVELQRTCCVSATVTQQRELIVEC